MSGLTEGGRGPAAADLRVLTVRPPWSWAIAYAGKTVENRSWPARYRGLLAVHAGKRPDKAAFRHPAMLEFYEQPGNPNPVYDCGLIVAVVTLSGCHHSDDCMHAGHLVPPGGRTGCSPWAARGQFHFELTGARPLPEPVPHTGALGIRPLPPSTEKAVRDQLGMGNGA